MERYDLYCDGCGKDIFNAMVGFCFPKHYECSGIFEIAQLVAKNYPAIRFREINGDVTFIDSVDDAVCKERLVHIINTIKMPQGECGFGFADGRQNVSLYRMEFTGRPGNRDGIIVWYLSDPKDKEKYYHEAGQVIHKMNRNNGSNTYGCYYCPACAQKESYICPQCGHPLVQHER